MARENQEIGPYRLISLLGTGGYGEVWLAERRTSVLTTRVALKLPRVGSVESDEIRREAEVWQRATGHPNIVPVLDADVYEGQIAIASEYVAGGTLAEWAAGAGGPIPDLELVVRLIDSILCGIQHLHELGIVHRDLKPENILLQAGTPRLTDFGLSRVLSTRNVTANAVGTPAYMAPECLRGAYSPASDIWSAGVILYELLQGKALFARSDILQTIAAVQGEAIPTLPDSVPSPLRALAAKMVVRDPEERLSGAPECRAALHALTATPGPVPESEGSNARHSRQAVADGPRSGGEDSVTWHVKLMGPLRLMRHEAEAPEQPGPRSAALLARLAFEPGRAVAREELMEMLWPDTPLDLQQQRMNITVKRLRDLLALEGVPGDRVLIGPDPLRLEPIYVQSDVSKMTADLQRAKKSEDDRARIALLDGVVALYEPELLKSFDQPWIPAARERVERLYMEAAEERVVLLGRLGEHDSAIRYATEILELDRLSEPRQCLLIFALVQAGRPCDAAAQFNDMVDLWRRELNTVPGARASRIGEEATRRCHAQPIAAAVPDSAARSAIPRPFSPILGRETEIARLKALLLDPAVRLVTLTGMGGAGKTRLAVEAATVLAPAFADAVWFLSAVDLSDRAMLQDGIRSLLNIRSEPGQEVPVQIARVLSAQPSLLVLDNFEHLADADSELLEELLTQAPSLTCLVTSRKSLQLGMETLFEVPPLPVPEFGPEGAGKHTRNIDEYPSVRLFVQRARRAKADFALTAENGPFVGDICRRLDGIPLAIELAAAWARMLTPADMVGQLKQILVSRDRSVPRHHQSLDAVIDASAARLAPELQRFLMGLSVLRGDWSAAAAAAVCEEPSAIRMLDDLLDASLIVAHEAGTTMRYRMLEPIREYCSDRVDRFGSRTELEANHRVFFHNVAREAAEELRGGDQPAAMKRVEAELPNLRAALDRSSDADRMRILAWTQLFWRTHGHLQEGRRRLSEALTGISDLPEAERGEVLLAAGVMEWMSADLGAARARLNESLAYCRACGDDRGTVKALGNLAAVAGAQGDVAESRIQLEASLEAARRLDEPRMLATILANIGTISQMLKLNEEAGQAYTEALALLDAFPNDMLRGDLLHNIADLEQENGRYSVALGRLRESLEVRKRLGDRRNLPHSLVLLGIIWSRLGELELSISAFEAADSAFKANGLPDRSESLETPRQLLSAARDGLSSQQVSDARAVTSGMEAPELFDWAIDAIGRWLDSHL